MTFTSKKKPSLDVMAKPDKPLLSLEAHGTLGGVITYSKPDSKGIVRRKPIPTDRRTLPQQYQRWLFQDYIALWQTLTPAQKQVWKTAATRYHMPGMAYFLRYYMKNQPDIAAYWTLDQGLPGQAMDSSPNQNHGIIYGASLVTGQIDHALSFDGLDNYIHIPYSTSLDLSAISFTAEYFARPTLDYASYGGLQCFHGAQYGFYLRVEKLRGYRARIQKPDRTPLDLTYAPPGGITLEPHHVAYVRDKGTMLYLYIDGELRDSAIDTFPDLDTHYYTRIARLVGWYFKGVIDHVIITRRALTGADMKRHSERRYP